MIAHHQESSFNYADENEIRAIKKLFQVFGAGAKAFVLVNAGNARWKL